jgi:2-hydroxymuconate-semialdehyde hydrolase
MISIVFTSGWAFRADAMQQISQHLDARFTCHHGDLGDWVSDQLPMPTRFAQWMEPHTTPVVLVGWSTGAMLSLEFALHHPARVAGLFLMGGALRCCDEPGEINGPSRASLRALRAALRTSPAPTLSRFVDDVAHPFPDERLHALLADHLDDRIAPLFAGLSYLERFDLRGTPLPEIFPPTFLLHGKGDKVVPLSRCLELCNHLHPAETVRYPGGGHALPFTHAKPIAGYITHHLDRLNPP